MAVAANRPKGVNPENNQIVKTRQYGVKASTTLYKGTRVALTGGNTHQLMESTDTSGQVCVGICQDYADNSSGSDNDLQVRVRRGGVFADITLSLSATASGAGTSFTYTNFPNGTLLFAGADGASVTTAGFGTNDILCGYLEEFVNMNYTTGLATDGEILMYIVHTADKLA